MRDEPIDSGHRIVSPVTLKLLPTITDATETDELKMDALPTTNDPVVVIPPDPIKTLFSTYNCDVMDTSPATLQFEAKLTVDPETVFPRIDTSDPKVAKPHTDAVDPVLCGPVIDKPPEPITARLLTDRSEPRLTQPFTETDEPNIDEPKIELDPPTCWFPEIEIDSIRVIPELVTAATNKALLAESGPPTINLFPIETHDLNCVIPATLN
jgi:hypothetical protein